MRCKIHGSHPSGTPLDSEHTSSAECVKLALPRDCDEAVTMAKSTSRSCLRYGSILCDCPQCFHDLFHDPLHFRGELFDQSSVAGLQIINSASFITVHF